MDTTKEEKKKEQGAYRSIFKATSLFGGVQVYNILIKIVKSKIVAVLLGPEGIGILGLLTSATELTKSVTSMGLSQSAVRDVSEANGTNDINRINQTVSVLRKLVWITGLLGTIVTACCAPLFSKFSFGNNEYIISFIILSVTLLIDQISAGQRVVLQGFRRLKDLSKSSVIGATLGLVFSVPIYYLYGKDGIVPTLVITSVSSLVISWYFSRKVKIDKVVLPIKEYFKYGRQMLVMGIAMSVSSILGHGVSYLIKGYISGSGGVSDVGIYQAGYAILTTYFGLIFSAIVTDYYPRLAAVNKDNEKCNKTVCQQGEITSMIIGPMLCLCLILMPYILKLLYSDKFLLACPFVMWGCLGMIFKIASWLISYVFVAKAESKLFMLNELLANIYTLVFSIVGYKLWGIEGLGIAFFLNYVIYFLQVYIIAKIRYNFIFTRSFIINYLLMSTMVVAIFLILFFVDSNWKYVFASLVAVVSIVYSLYSLRNLLNFSLKDLKIFKK